VGHLHRVDGGQGVTQERPWKRAAPEYEARPWQRAAPEYEARPWKRATLWLAFLGPFFFASYGLTNWLASLRADVGVAVFAWEQHIPYVPWSIVPYWSIDAFYAASLFVCATRRELDSHAKRLLAAQVIAVFCFLLFPLRYSFTRPETTGFFGLMLDALLAFDKPFNQAPALHIVLLVILWVLYARVLRGAWRWLLHLWFALIGVSVLTTYQHHFIDIPTGLLAGWLCVWLFPDTGASAFASASLTHDARRRTLALRYFGGAIAVALPALALGGWAWWLLWISVSLAMVGCIYLFLNDNLFQKRNDGTHAPATRWLLAPYLLGARINSRWWTRACNSADRVTPQLWIGRVPLAAKDIPPHIKTIVDLCAELPCAHGSAAYVSLPMLDLVTMTAAQLHAAARAIDDASGRGPVLVCCALGYSRSAAAAAAWLLVSGNAATAREAITQVQAARAQVVLSESQRLALDELAATCTRAR
jgi:membrane-associated phospholipid phosphatase